MSEKLEHHEHQSHESYESHESSPEHPKKHEHLQVKHEQEEHQIKVERVQQEVERQHPTESAELLDKLEPVEEPKPVHPPNKELKQMALKTYLREIRASLGAPSKVLSKFIHQPQINAISEFSGKTIVRPSAILSAGFFTFAGSALYLYATYHTGAKYNFFMAIFLFVGGFIAGLILELFYRLFFKRS